ncbi:type-F conjugative transfer system protein TrbI [Cedecea sp. NFIX57]|uniref:type-F conjugative transfer system protein TrbI n=1 Tax=Cedecea sp. NFIX57 TaxID=1566286 RepID=UPI000A0DFA64|nr:type-F conjugative transfer system protein TrbI [Cedecea sp. NFIX57]SMG59795.1 conjugal transfer pilin signal peptidase TrbI [Cedecea sp. NFIX57]
MTTESGATPRPRVSRRARRYLAAAGLMAGVLAANVMISLVLIRTTAPRVVAFDMKQTVDAFFDRAGRQKLTEPEMKQLSDRFNLALEASLQAYQRQHHVQILVAGAVVQPAPDITVQIQREIAGRMKVAP